MLDSRRFSFLINNGRVKQYLVGKRKCSRFERAFDLGLLGFNNGELSGKVGHIFYLISDSLWSLHNHRFW